MLVEGFAKVSAFSMLAGPQPVPSPQPAWHLTPCTPPFLDLPWVFQLPSWRPPLSLLADSSLTSWPLNTGGTQELATYSLQAHPVCHPVPVNKASLELSHAHSFPYCPGCFLSTVAELSHRNRDPISHKACKIPYLAPPEKHADPHPSYYLIILFL